MPMNWPSVIAPLDALGQRTWTVVEGGTSNLVKSPLAGTGHNSLKSKRKFHLGLLHGILLLSRTMDP